MRSGFVRVFYREDAAKWYFNNNLKVSPDPSVYLAMVKAIFARGAARKMLEYLTSNADRSTEAEIIEAVHQETE